METEISASPTRAAIAITARWTIHGTGYRVENTRLNAGPDVLDQTANARNPLRIWINGSQFDVGLLGLRDHGELQPDRLVGELPNQFVINQQLSLAGVGLCG